MGSTMVQLVQQVSNELGLVAPSTVAGNNAQDVIQTLALMNASGYELLKRHDWRELTRPYRFTVQYLATTGTWTTSSAAITGIPDTTGLDTTYMAVGTGINQDTLHQWWRGDDSGVYPIRNHHHRNTGRIRQLRHWKHGNYCAYQSRNTHLSDYLPGRKNIRNRRLVFNDGSYVGYQQQQWCVYVFKHGE
jgi:hypothetical protein